MFTQKRRSDSCRLLTISSWVERVMGNIRIVKYKKNVLHGLLSKAFLAFNEEGVICLVNLGEPMDQYLLFFLYSPSGLKWLRKIFYRCWWVERHGKGEGRKRRKVITGSYSCGESLKASSRKHNTVQSFRDVSKASYDAEPQCESLKNRIFNRYTLKGTLRIDERRMISPWRGGRIEL